MSGPAIPPGAVALERFGQPRVSQSPVADSGQQNTAAAQRVAAQKFEAMTIAQLLKPMFATMGKADPPFGGGTVERSFRPFLIDAIGREMEKRGGLGLAPMIEAALDANSTSSTAGYGASRASIDAHFRLPPGAKP